MLHGYKKDVEEGKYNKDDKIIKNINKIKPITTSHSSHSLGSESIKSCLRSHTLRVLLFAVKVLTSSFVL